MGVLGQPTIVIMSTHPITLRTFLRRQLVEIRRHGFLVHAVSSPGREFTQLSRETGVPCHAIPMRRGISPCADARALLGITRLLRRLRPDIVQTHTPKAGLLGMVAARLCGIPARIYTSNGLVLESKAGALRRLLLATERLACRCATQVLVVSHSLAEALIDLRVCAPERIKLLGRGSSHGVDVDRFDPRNCPPSQAARLREHLGIPAGSPAIGFVGRIVRDKGIEDLAGAWRILRGVFRDAHLAICGDFESHDPVSPAVARQLEQDPRIHLSGGFLDDMPSLYAAVDLCVLPTYREGLPNVLLEAGAMERPVVATRVTGCVDAVRDGVTGILVPPRDPARLAEAIGGLLHDPDRRAKMGAAARRYVTAEFSEDRVTARLLAEYRRLLEENHRPLPGAAGRCASTHVETLV